VLGLAGVLVYQHREQVLGTGMLSEAQALKDYEALPPYAREILSKHYTKTVELPPGTRTKYRLAGGGYQSCTLGRLVLDCLLYHRDMRKEVWLEGVVVKGKGPNQRTQVLFRQRPLLDRRRVAGGGAQTIVCLDVASMFGMAATQYGALYIERAPDWSGMACKVAIDGKVVKVSEEETDLDDDSLFFTRICYACEVEVVNPRGTELKKGDKIDAFLWPDLYPPHERGLVVKGSNVGAAYLNRDVRINGKFVKGAWFLYETAPLR
jgi:hypothetical protein